MRFRLGVIGLGDLDLPCAEAFARHQDVIGYDRVPRTNKSVAHPPHCRRPSPARTSCSSRSQRHMTRPAAATASPPTCHHTLRLQCGHLGHNRNQLACVGWAPRNHTPGCRSTALECASADNPYLIAISSIEWDVVNPEMVIIGTQDGAAARLGSFNDTFVQCVSIAIGTFEVAE